MNPWQIYTQAVRTDGNVSTMRVVVLTGCLISLFVPALLWLASAYWPSVQPICVPASGVFGGTLTALLGLKLVQNGQENASPEKPAAPPSA